jgi:hypothetical protein
MKAVDCARGGVTGAKNLTRPVLIRQELWAKFLERKGVKQIMKNKTSGVGDGT